MLLAQIYSTSYKVTHLNTIAIKLMDLISKVFSVKKIILESKIAMKHKNHFSINNFCPVGLKIAK
jgi:hypothetical protein